MAQSKQFTPARFHQLEAQLVDLRDERRELLRQLRRLESENISLRDRLAAEQARSKQMVAKLGAIPAAWTLPGLVDRW